MRESTQKQNLMLGAIITGYQVVVKLKTKVYCSDCGEMNDAFDKGTSGPFLLSLFPGFPNLTQFCLFAR
jgi:hypothetical protein